MCFILKIQQSSPYTSIAQTLPPLQYTNNPFYMDEKCVVTEMKQIESSSNGKANVGVSDDKTKNIDGEVKRISTANRIGKLVF